MTNPFAHANTIWPMCPLPLFNNQVSAAPKDVAVAFPTPTDFNTASVASAPVIELENA